MSKNFIGVLYNNVIRAEGQRECIVQAKDVILGEKGFLHLKEGMRLGTDDIKLESVRGLPLYVDHRYELGQMGVMPDAFYSDNKSLGSQHYNAGIHFNQSKEPDGLQLCIRGEVWEDKLPFVLQTLGISDLSEAALSIGYRYSYEVHERNNAGQALSYRIVNKEVYEGSLCKYGRIANSGVLMTLAESNSLSTEYFGEGSYRIKLQEQQKQQINNNSRMSAEQPSNPPTDQTNTPPSDPPKEEKNIRNSAPALDDDAAEKMMRDAIALGVDVTKPDWVPQLFMAMSSDRQKRIDAHKEQWRPVIERSINSLKECVKLSQTYSFSDPEIEKIHNYMLSDDVIGQLNAKAFAALSDRIASQDKQLAEMKNSIESLQKTSTSKRGRDEEVESDDEQQESASTNSSKKMRTDEPKRGDISNRYKNNAKDEWKEKLQNSFLFSGSSMNSVRLNSVQSIQDQLRMMEDSMKHQQKENDKRVRSKMSY